ncbi:MAG TPA: hypothetical protein VJ044_08070, partial [Candidatus Hodarchaeales archaeon]|nr:hypothetical protein [Candidatus Hodarchaeales archaeon]
VPLFADDHPQSVASDLIRQHAVSVDEYRDGYSQRPVFIKIRNLEWNLKENSDVKNTLERYCRFLAKRGELLGWETSETRVVIWLRVLTFPSPGLRQLVNRYRQLTHMILKKSLTTVVIDWRSMEASLKIPHEVYKDLEEVTYHSLGHIILNHILESFNKFASGNERGAYSSLHPLAESIKREISASIQFRPKPIPAYGRKTELALALFLATTLFFFPWNLLFILVLVASSVVGIHSFQGLIIYGLLGVQFLESVLVGTSTFRILRREIKTLLQPMQVILACVCISLVLISLALISGAENWITMILAVQTCLSIASLVLLRLAQSEYGAQTESEPKAQESVGIQQTKV